MSAPVCSHHQSVDRESWVIPLLRRGFFRDASVDAFAEPFDPGAEHLAGLEVDRGLAGVADAAGGAGEHQVAGPQGDRLADVGHLGISQVQGREDIPLNEVGKKQRSSQSAAALQAESWDIIISSPLIRAQETAKEIAGAIGLPSILLDERFMERNFGEASGKPVAAVRELIAEGNVEGMEQDEEIVERCFTGFTRGCSSTWR